MKIIVYNVNDDILILDDIIIFVVFCIINCLVLMVKVLQDVFGIIVGIMIIIYVYIGIQLLVDGLCGKDLCVFRVVVENVILYIIGVVKVIGLVIFVLSGKLKGYVQCVLIKIGLVMELVLVLEKKVIVDEVNQVMRQVVEGNEFFGYIEEEIVFFDIIGSYFGLIYDVIQLEIVEVGGVQLVKIVVWYDNEYGFVI